MPICFYYGATGNLCISLKYKYVFNKPKLIVTELSFSETKPLFYN